MPSKRARPRKDTIPELPKAPTGIAGLDEITGGGLPRGRPTLVCGGAGCGKTMLAAEFLARGAVEYDEPGVFMMFEESSAELTQNMRSLGYDFEKLQKKKKLALDYVHIERSEIEETGDYDLEGLFIRLGHAIDSIGAKRVVIDTLEALFSGLPNHAVLRAELRRLFRWLKDRGMTAIITGERGDQALTRYGLEEYVADCVILLDHRIVEQVSTRRLRILKYRGSAHGTNEYPFLIGKKGVSVLPITSLGLEHEAVSQRVPTGIKSLDEMLGGKGVYRGSSVLVSGSPGTGKSSIGASFAEAACRRGERVVLFAYEESTSQLIRNMRSVGIRLADWQRKGLLEIHATRPTLHGLEQHLVQMHEAVHRAKPSLVVVDPISNLTMDHHDVALKAVLMRLIDFLKQARITGVFTSLTADNDKTIAQSEGGVSSLMDSWILLANHQYNGERTRTLQVLKSRGMAHSHQVREFILSDQGIDMVDVYLSQDTVLMGTARIAKEAQERDAAQLRERDHERKLRELASYRKTIDAQIMALNAEAEKHTAEIEYAIARDQLEANSLASRANHIAQTRGRDARPSKKSRKS